jgi:ubiquinone/menaquinone biosynthesis C-methylase UbiE
MLNQIPIRFDRLAAEYSAKYDNPTGIFGYEKRRRMELLLDCVEEINPRSTLDAGCGSGVVLAALQSRLPGAQCAGVDLSHLMLKQAHTNTLTKVPFIQCLVEQLPFVDKSFDLIYALGILDYLEHPAQFFKTVWRVLKPGGWFIFTYPSGDSISRMLRTWLRTYLRSPQAVSAVAIKGRNIDGLLADHGFELIRRHYITYGNGLISLPWSLMISRKMEQWYGQRPISRYLGWSCFCVTRKSEA